MVFCFDCRKNGQALTPSRSAALLLLEDIWSEEAIDSTSDYVANLVTLTAGDELSRLIAQFLAGTITAKQENVATPA